MLSPRRVRPPLSVGSSCPTSSRTLIPGNDTPNATGRYGLQDRLKAMENHEPIMPGLNDVIKIFDSGNCVAGAKLGHVSQHAQQSVINLEPKTPTESSDEMEAIDANSGNWHMYYNDSASSTPNANQRRGLDYQGITDEMKFFASNAQNWQRDNNDPAASYISNANRQHSLQKQQQMAIHDLDLQSISETVALSSSSSNLTSSRTLIPGSDISSAYRRHGSHNKQSSVASEQPEPNELKVRFDEKDKFLANVNNWKMQNCNAISSISTLQNTQRSGQTMPNHDLDLQGISIGMDLCNSNFTSSRTLIPGSGVSSANRRHGSLNSMRKHEPIMQNLNDADSENSSISSGTSQYDMKLSRKPMTKHESLMQGRIEKMETCLENAQKWHLHNRDSGSSISSANSQHDLQPKPNISGRMSKRKPLLQQEDSNEMESCVNAKQSYMHNSKSSSSISSGKSRHVTPGTQIMPMRQHDDTLMQGNTDAMEICLANAQNRQMHNTSSASICSQNSAHGLQHKQKSMMKLEPVFQGSNDAMKSNIAITRDVQMHNAEFGSSKRQYGLQHKQNSLTSANQQPAMQCSSDEREALNSGKSSNQNTMTSLDETLSKLSCQFSHKMSLRNINRKGSAYEKMPVRRNPAGGRKVESSCSSKNAPTFIPATKVVREHVLCASRLNAITYENQLADMNNKIEELMCEKNKLETVQKRQQAALAKYESKNGELSHLKQSHVDAVRTWQNKFTQLTAVNRELLAEIKTKEMANDKLYVENRHLDRLDRNMKLESRKQLLKRIKAIENQIELKDNEMAIMTCEYEQEVDHLNDSIQQEQIKTRHFTEALEQINTDIAGYRQLEAIENNLPEVRRSFSNLPLARCMPKDEILGNLRQQAAKKCSKSLQKPHMNDDACNTLCEMGQALEKEFVKLREEKVTNLQRADGFVDNARLRRANARKAMEPAQALTMRDKRNRKLSVIMEETSSNHKLSNDRQYTDIYKYFEDDDGDAECNCGSSDEQADLLCGYAITQPAKVGAKKLEQQMHFDFLKEQADSNSDETTCDFPETQQMVDNYANERLNLLNKMPANKMRSVKFNKNYEQEDFTDRQSANTHKATAKQAADYGRKAENKTPAATRATMKQKIRK